MSQPRKKQQLHLGNKVKGSEYYDPDLLQCIPRIDNRKKIGLYNPPPFMGYDVWNCYEFSFLNQNGCPMNYILKIMYSSDSPSIVESKSLKLYLNSMNMSMMESLGDIKSILRTIESDLSGLLQTKVWVNIFNSDYIGSFEQAEGGTWTSLEKQLHFEEVICDQYTHDSNLLKIEDHGGLHWKSTTTNVLRSCCKVTAQPDFGQIYIRMCSKSTPTWKSLYKYLVSFRNENHFHEEIVEQIYHDLNLKCRPERLLVFAKYTRRGGIDINPIRASHIDLITSACEDLLDIDKRSIKTLRQ